MQALLDQGLDECLHGASLHPVETHIGSDYPVDRASICRVGTCDPARYFCWTRGDIHRCRPVPAVGMSCRQTIHPETASDSGNGSSNLHRDWSTRALLLTHQSGCSTTELAVSLSCAGAISQHTKILREAGLLTTTAAGNRCGCPHIAGPTFLADDRSAPDGGAHCRVPAVRSCNQVTYWADRVP